MCNKYGLIGEKLDYSLSPKIHKIIFDEIEINGQYDLFEFNQNTFDSQFKEVKNSEVNGVNVTIPFKEKVIKHLTDIHGVAEKLGAVNNIFFDKGKAFGYNTDYYGFGMMLDVNGIRVKNKKITILGTGGAAKAAAWYLIDNNADDVIFVSRDSQKNVICDMKTISYNQLNNYLDRDIIVNCTPCGMGKLKKESPVSVKVLAEYKVAVDLIYNPLETIFLKESKNKKLITVNGLYMLVAQAVKSQEIWHNCTMPDGLIQRVYRKIVGKLDRVKRDKEVKR